MSEFPQAEDSYRPEAVSAAPELFVVVSGCSGGGKSALLTALGRRGHPVYEEAGRQVVREQVHIGGPALPWSDVGLFVELTVSRSIHNMIEAARAGRRAFFDRGIVDQVSGLGHSGVPVPPHLTAALTRFRYHETVFLLPPWREVFRNDAERRHGFDEAVASYERLAVDYQRLGYRIVEVPRADVEARANFVLEALG